MSRTLRALTALFALVFLVFYIATSTRASDEPQTVRVTLSDYHVELSQYTVTPGKAVQFIVTNGGGLTHQLLVEPYSGVVRADSHDAPIIAAGSTLVFQRTLNAGIYRVECLEWDHADRGMVNVLAADLPRTPTTRWRLDLLIPVFGLVVGAAYIISDSLR